MSTFVSINNYVNLVLFYLFLMVDLRPYFLLVLILSVVYRVLMRMIVIIPEVMMMVRNLMELMITSKTRDLLQKVSVIFFFKKEALFYIQNLHILLGIDLKL